MLTEDGQKLAQQLREAGAKLENLHTARLRALDMPAGEERDRLVLDIDLAIHEVEERLGPLQLLVHCLPWEGV